MPAFTFALKKIATSLILPPAGPILLALAGLWLARRWPRFGRGLSIASLLGLLAMSLPPVAGWLASGLETYRPISDVDLKRAQAIVVLGGGKYFVAPEYGQDTISRWSLERARYAAHLQRRSKLPILVAGGAPDGGRPEGDALKEALTRDFNAAVTWVDARSADTGENAAQSAALLKKAGISRIALVTHAWHMPRATALFVREGLTVIPAPTGFTTPSPSQLFQLTPSTTALDKSRLALHEWLGMLAEQIKTAVR